MLAGMVAAVEVVVFVDSDSGPGLHVADAFVTVGFDDAAVGAGDVDEQDLYCQMVGLGRSHVILRRRLQVHSARGC